MELSKRLSLIVDNIEECEVVADIGTDHGYIPIYLAKNDRVKKAIASDINKDPLDKAKLNSIFEGVDDIVDVRLGGGLETIKKGEVNTCVIAGMGGNLIKDILEADKEKTASIDTLILQPAQNPEVLREYLYTSGYEIMKEDLCFEEGIYYEMFKVRVKKDEKTELEKVFYEVSPMLLREKHYLMKEYLEVKIEKCKKIVELIKDESDSAKERRKEMKEKIEILENLIKYC